MQIIWVTLLLVREFDRFEMTIEQAAEQVLNPFIAPLAVMLLVTVADPVAGGTGFVLNNSILRREHGTMTTTSKSA